jgi:hypothetical protein
VGGRVVYARSRRATVALAALALCLGGMLLGLACGSAIGGRPAPGLLLGAAGVVALAAGARQLRHLLRWPASRLGLFRDRVLVSHGPQELQVLWPEIEVVSLAAQAEWGVMEWPAVRLTDRLTLRLRGGGLISFRPAALGLAPILCRDLLLRFRDDPGARERLPAFEAGISGRRPRSGQPALPDM